MLDVHYEVKSWNPLIKSTTARGAGVSWENGGTVASVGHLYGFGNTLDKALTGSWGARSVAVSRWTDRSITRLEFLSPGLTA